jgi:dephospho-CoA kinase
VHVFGLTGGIASGKSAVSARFRERGLPVIDADMLSREVAVIGSDAVNLVAEAFGAQFLGEDGSLDRKKLSAHVFGDAAKVRTLNAIMLPRIAALSSKKTAELAARGEPLACYEAALLVENKLADAFRPLVVVAASLEVQVARAAKRDGLPEEAVRKRIAAQLPLAEKIRAADIVIQNDGTLDALRTRADDALDEVCGRTRVDASRYPREDRKKS